MYLIQLLLSIAFYTSSHDVLALFLCSAFFWLLFLLHDLYYHLPIRWKNALFSLLIWLTVFFCVWWSDRNYNQQFAHWESKAFLQTTGIVLNHTKQGQYDFEDSLKRVWILKTEKELEIGQIIGVSWKVKTVDLHKKLVFGEFDYDRRLRMKGYVGQITPSKVWIASPPINGPSSGSQWRGKEEDLILILRRKLADRIELVFGKDKEAGLLYGMLLGSRSGITKEQYDSFVQSGLVHLIAVSGANIVMVSLLLAGLLFWLPYYIRLLFICIGIVLYGIVCGGDSSVVRAVIMWLLWIASLYAGKMMDTMRIVLMTMVAMLFYNPYSLVFDMWFSLSFAAVFGLVLTNEWWKKALDTCKAAEETKTAKDNWRVWKPKKNFKKLLTRGLGDYLVPTFGATFGVLPILIIFSGHYNLTSILGNIFVNPLVGMITIAWLLVLAIGSYFSFPILVIKYLLNLIYRVSDNIIAHAYVLSSDNWVGKLIIVLIFVYVLYRMKNEN